MKKLLFIILTLFYTTSYSQNSLEELLAKYNTQNIPYISVQELAMPKTHVVILDAREQTEYEVSHIKEAIFVGYNNFDMDAVLRKITNKNETIVVYCSLGIRSETVASKLKKAGYTSVLNLYGGIFEWKNNDFKVFNSQGKETEDVHVFSKEWSPWLLKGNKVF